MYIHIIRISPYKLIIDLKIFYLPIRAPWSETGCCKGYKNTDLSINALYNTNFSVGFNRNS